MTAPTTLLTNAASGSSAIFLANGVAPNSNDNPFIGLEGTFGGATVTLEWLSPNNNWNPTDSVNDIATAPKLLLPFINNAVKYRLTISGGSGVSISAWGYNCQLA